MEEPKNGETITPNQSEKVKPSTDWINEELEEIKQNSFDGEKKPALKLEEGKIVTMTIDFSEPFQKWEDKEKGTIKKIIPVRVGEADLVWWLNVKNPIYGKIMEQAKEGKNVFKVLQTGSQDKTTYNLVEE